MPSEISLKPVTVAGAVIAGLLACAGALAQTPRETMPQAPAATKSAAAPTPAVKPPTHALDAPDLGAFIDGIVPLQLERSDGGGAVVLVMRDGNVLLEKGYGYADAKKKIPVDAETTMFRPGSISKLFIWIAVMQLVEKGKLNLDSDVNGYLDFTIPTAFGQPVTMRNLMTHTGGFEESIRDLIRGNPKDFAPLRRDLVENQPHRIYPPGQVGAYSNWGAGLAGYIVQRLSGEPFPAYVRRHIFEPLAMTHSSFEQPLPPALQPLMSVGYESVGGKTLPFEMVNPSPAGALSSSAGDMARFSRALLNGGESGGARILQPATLQSMWTPQFRENKALPAAGLGFYQTRRNNVTCYGHGGDLIAFHSLYLLCPEQRLALFVSYNSAGSDGKLSRSARPELFNDIADRYFPATDPPLGAPDRKMGAALVGTYQPTRRTESNIGKLFTLLNQTSVSQDKDGDVLIAAIHTLRGPVKRWRFAGQNVWREVEGQGEIAAVRDTNGRVVRIAGDFPAQEWQRVVWYERFRWIGPALAIAAAILLFAALSSLGYAFRKWKRRSAPVEGKRGPGAAIALPAIGWTVAMILFCAPLAAISSNPLPPGHEFDLWLLVWDIAVGIAIALTLIGLIWMARTWRGRRVSPKTRLWGVVVTLSALFMCWFTIQWHIFGNPHHF